MRALHYSQFGSADVFEVGEVPDPHRGPDTLVVQVKAAGLNPVDWKIRQGYLQGAVDVHFPAVPGWDVSGVVVQAGLDTPEFAVGDEVFAYARADVVHGGTVAELAAVPVRTAALKPRNLSHEQAAAVPLAGLTALQALRRAGVGEGDTVLIHGGAGGVGTFGIQLARLAGARVVATASAANHEFLEGLGATAISYGEGLAQRALEASPDGYSKILDFAGGASLDVTHEVLAQGGTVASIADARAKTEFGGHYVWVRPSSSDLEHLAGLLNAGKLTVEVAEVFDLDHSIDAYRLLEGGHVRGKVVVRV